MTKTACAPVPHSPSSAHRPRPSGTGRTPAIQGDQHGNGRRNPCASPKMAIHTPKCGQTSVADSDTKRETNETTFSPQKPVSSYGLVPIRTPFWAIFHPSSDTKLPRMRPDFRSWLRYNHAANETTSRYEKLKHSYDCGRISYEHAPHALSPQLRNAPRMRPNFRSWLRYNHETTETNPVRPEPVEGHPVAPVPNVIAAKAAIQTNGAK